MTEARWNTVTDEEAVYHCISRCVRRAFLYGYDAYSKFNYDHRKDWLKDRLKFLISVFTIEVLDCALMDNHQHTLLRTRPDLLAELSDEQVAHRWLSLYPRAEFKGSLDSELARQYVQMLCQDAERITELRQRLGSVSWFMKSVNEFIARKANAEDKCKGRFWEGRFRCIKVEGEGAILGCAVYIDLNPIRAGKADTPETSKYTGAYERIRGLKKKGLKDGEEPELWLAPVQDTARRRGFLSITLNEYLSILDATGRELKKGKRGRIPSELEPILVRLGLEPASWLETAGTFGKKFSHFAGPEESLLKAAVASGKKWLKGLSHARRAFL
jgi:hypothetical protein